MERYQKNVMIKGFGEAGQKKLKDATIAVIGLGGLGGPVSLYLAAAGVGRLILCDFDVVETSNLQRQILYRENEIGKQKIEAALEKIKALNSTVEVIPLGTRWEEAKEDLLRLKPDLLIDALDRIKGKFALNDFAVLNRIPFIHAGITAMQGQITTIIPGESGCLRCVFSSEFPEETSAEEHGILGPAAGNMGTLQAVEAIKLLTGIGETLKNCFLFIDYKTNSFRTMSYQKKKGCLCGTSNG